MNLIALSVTYQKINLNKGDPKTYSQAGAYMQVHIPNLLQNNSKKQKNQKSIRDPTLKLNYIKNIR